MPCPHTTLAVWSDRRLSSGTIGAAVYKDLAKFGKVVAQPFKQLDATLGGHAKHYYKHGKGDAQRDGHRSDPETSGKSVTFATRTRSTEWQARRTSNPGVAEQNQTLHALVSLGGGGAGACSDFDAWAQLVGACWWLPCMCCADLVRHWGKPLACLLPGSQACSIPAAHVHGSHHGYHTVAGGALE